VYVFVYLA